MELNLDMQEEATARKFEWPLKAGIGKKMESPFGAPRMNTALLTSILTQWDTYPTSKFQKCKIMNFCCFKPLSV